MKAEFVINRQGKDFVLFAGLLDEATSRGLTGIATEVVTVTATLAVFKATATFSDDRRFTAHGDATPENVGRNIAPHFIRMAETRAKARALRDALNIGGASLEEQGDDDGPPAPARARPPQRAAAVPPREEHRNGQAAAPVQPRPLLAEALDLAHRARGAGLAPTEPIASATDAALRKWMDHWAPLLAAREALSDDAPQEGVAADDVRRPTGELPGPRWGGSDLGKEVSRMVDALLTLPEDDPRRRFVLPANAATDDEVRQWIGSKRRLLESKTAQR